LTQEAVGGRWKRGRKDSNGWGGEGGEGGVVKVVVVGLDPAFISIGNPIGSWTED